MVSGYSKTPLFKKLGIKSGMSCALYHTFKELTDLISPFPDDVTVNYSFFEEQYDIILWCVNDIEELEGEVHQLMKRIKKSGMIWVMWYKKSSKKQRTVNEDVIRATVLPLGLVDVKVCAVDQDWSGLKIVYRLENR